MTYAKSYFSDLFHIFFRFISYLGAHGSKGPGPGPGARYETNMKNIRKNCEHIYDLAYVILFSYIFHILAKSIKTSTSILFFYYNWIETHSFKKHNNTNTYIHTCVFVCSFCATCFVFGEQKQQTSFLQKVALAGMLSATGNLHVKGHV